MKLDDLTPEQLLEYMDKKLAKAEKFKRTKLEYCTPTFVGNEYVDVKDSKKEDEGCW